MMGTDSKRNAVALFVRNPVPGRVKTRLARVIGNRDACDFYQAIVADVLDSIVSCGVPVYLFHDGDVPLELPDAWTDAATDIVAQQGATLGDRMASAFTLLFKNGFEHVALMGSDIPGLDSALIMAAFAALEAHDAVIVPAVDGGYCLIALKRASYHKQIFENIAWSTDRVLQTTLARMDDCGVRANLLENRQDIDTLEDLKEYYRNPAKTAQSTNNWLSDSKWFQVNGIPAVNP